MSGVYNEWISQKNIHIYVAPLEYTFLSYIPREGKLFILKKKNSHFIEMHFILLTSRS